LSETRTRRRAVLLLQRTDGVNINGWLLSLYIALVGLTAPCVANASEWWLAAEDDKSIFVVDRASVGPVEVNSRTYIKAWGENFDIPAGFNRVASTKVLRYVSCSSGSIAVKTFTSYGFDDAIIQSSTVPDSRLNFETVRAGTVGSSIIAFICNAENGAGRTEFKVGTDEFAFVSDVVKLVAQLSVPHTSESPSTTPVR
jgi:hypothetical protein